jgi:hypothetical protein
MNRRDDNYYYDGLFLEDGPFGYSGKDLHRLNRINRGRFEEEDYDEEDYDRELRRKKERRQMKRKLLLMAARGLLL